MGQVQQKLVAEIVRASDRAKLEAWSVEKALVLSMSSCSKSADSRCAIRADRPARGGMAPSGPGGVV